MIRRSLLRLFLPILRFLFPRSGLFPSISLPSPPERVPKIEVGCEFAEGFTEPPEGLGDLKLTGRDDIGIFRGDTVRVTERILVVGPLIILARRDILVDQSIIRTRPGLGQNQDIILTSFNGTVRIDGGAIVGFGTVPTGSGTPADPPSLRTGRQGDPGSLTLIRAISVEVDGNIQGEVGGQGETITSSNADLRGRSWAFGGPGGAGGDVVLCALEGVRLGPIGRVIGGSGGDGGNGEAVGSPGVNVVGIGGPAHHGGDVVIRGLAPDATCQVFMEAGAWLKGGNGGYGPVGLARRNRAVPPGPEEGGEGSATGGDGGKGGAVRFENCTVVRVAVVESGHGGNGGPAAALGGNGGTAGVGLPGGDAIARGGTAGESGPEPRIPLADGTVGRGIRGRSGSGREAEAVPGDGGTASGLGGDSGSGSARGGPNGAGGQAQEIIVPPTPPAGGTGGKAQRAVSKGAK